MVPRPLVDRRLRLSAGSLVLAALLTLLLAGCGGTAPPSPSGGGGGGGGGGGNLACSVMMPGQTASLGGFVPFTSSSLWNTDISGAAVNSNSSTIMSNWVGSVYMHPDFG